MPVEVHHHEVAAAGECEIGVRFAPLVPMPDHLVMDSYIIEIVARAPDKTATFTLEPLGRQPFRDARSSSLCKDGQTLMADEQRCAGLSQPSKESIGYG